MVNARGGLDTIPRGIDELPLTTFAEKYGKIGLHQRLERRLGDIGIRGGDYDLVARSTELGLAIHATSKPRTYESFVNHILRVPLRVIEQLGIADPEVITGSILHDTVEMHPREVISFIEGEYEHVDDEEAAREIALTGLARYTTGIVAQYVSDTTAPLRQPGADRIQAYKDYTWAIFTKGLPGSKVIKKADFLDNVTPPSRGEAADKRARLDAKQLPVYEYHIDSLTHSDSLVPEERRDSVRGLLQSARAAALLRVAQEREHRKAMLE